MPVESKHPEYSSNEERWSTCRSTIEGEERIKAEGVTRLPMLGGQDQNEYDAYKKRASFYGATSRTVDGLVGVVFRKDPVINFPKSREELLKRVSKEKLPFNTFAKRVFNNVIGVGRHGVLLDVNTSDIKQDPFLVGYTTESILNWRMGMVDGELKLTMVVLKEDKLGVDPSDPFVSVPKEEIRVLRLTTDDPENENNSKVYYRVDIYKKKTQSGNAQPKDNKDAYVLFETIIPNIRGTKLDYIPFVFFGPLDLTPAVQKPPILDIATINISHYMNSADLEHGRHFTALPTAWTAGFDVDRGTNLKIGSTVAWVASEPTAKAGFLEFTGEGLGALVVAMETKEAQMAILGARLLEEPKRAVEATETHKMRKAGEDSVLASIVGVTEEGFRKLLTWAAEWMALPTNDIDVAFNKDFMLLSIDPQLMTAMLTALQANRLSVETWLYNLQKGELMPEGRTIEEEMALIEDNPPMGATPNPNELNPLGEEDEEESDEEEEEEE